MKADSPKPPDELKRILELMLKKDKILILSHVDPDGDSIGSQIALGNFLQSKGKKVMMVNKDEIPSRYRFLDPQKRIKRNFKGFQPDLILVLECSNLNRIGNLIDLLPSPAEIVNIDHHPDNTLFGTINHLDPEASATGEIIYDLLKFANYTFDPDTAFALYTAILTDTGRFSFPNTNSRSLMICSELIQRGADPRSITDQLYFNHSEGCLKLLGKILENLELRGNGKYCSLTITHQALKDYRVKPRETEGFVDYTLFLKGVVVGSLFMETSHQVIQVSLRSQNSIDVGAVAKFFGGGGHRNASGLTLNRDLKDAKNMVHQKILKALEYDWRRKKKDPQLVKK
jgi:phosphoesterase RecJ-like protein